jgi:hypothetical protein
MRTVLAALLTLSLYPAAALADRTLNSEKSAAIDCAKDPGVVINVSEGSYTITGACDRIAINGAGNKVTIASVSKLSINGAKNAVDLEAADKIAVNGTDNTVNYKRGVTTKSPKVMSTGANNKINQVK